MNEAPVAVTPDRAVNAPSTWAASLLRARSISISRKPPAADLPLELIVMIGYPLSGAVASLYREPGKAKYPSFAGLETEGSLHSPAG